MSTFLTLSDNPVAAWPDADTCAGMLRGDRFGKMVAPVDEEPTR